MTGVTRGPAERAAAQRVSPGCRRDVRLGPRRASRESAAPEHADQRGGHRHQGQPGQQPLSRDQPVLLRPATRARADVPGDPLAPQRAGHPIPARGGELQARAGGFGAQRPHHHPADGELLLHPADAHRDMGRGQAERGGELTAAQLARGLQPPQGQQLTVPGVEPAGGLGGLLALAGQAEPEDGQLHEVGLGVGDLMGQVRGRNGLPGPVMIAHLPDGHGDQPGPERGGIAQVAQAPDGAEHGFLHHVVHVGVPAEAAADDVVDQRQVAGQQVIQRLRIPGLGGDHRLHPWPAAARHVHGTSPSSVWAARHRPQGRRRRTGPDNRKPASGMIPRHGGRDGCFGAGGSARPLLAVISESARGVVVSARGLLRKGRAPAPGGGHRKPGKARAAGACRQRP